MKTWENISQWREERSKISGKVGFVPTMGALHSGHISLASRCRKENEIVVGSIFVNPTQFNDPKDLERYPRTLEADLLAFSEAGVDHVILPTKEQIYPDGYRFKIIEDEISKPMEGTYRPGYFQGIMTVVMKLLNLVQPQKVYLGEKDYQMMVLLREMVKEFFMPIEIIPCPTVREKSGLAASSRNELVSPETRAKAAVIYKSLTELKSCDEVRTAIEKAGLIPECVEEHYGRRFVTAFADGVRLLDNVPIGV